MNEEEKKDYLKYIENYTINDLADMFNTQNFVIQDKDKFNEILLYYHFKQNEEIEQLQKENKELKEHIEKYERYCKTTGIEELMKNKKYKEVIDKASNFIDYNTKYRNGADIYQFVDIESEILEPLKFILELDEENGNAYLKEFKDWLKGVE